MRLIDVDNVIEKLHAEIDLSGKLFEGEDPVTRFKKKVMPKLLNDVIKYLQNQPTVDAVPVVHGRWKYTPVSGRLYCGVCDRLPECQLETDYCPNCGAKMDEEERAF